MYRSACRMVVKQEFARVGELFDPAAWPLSRFGDTSMQFSSRCSQNQTSHRRPISSCGFELLEQRHLLAGTVASPQIDQAIAGDSNLDGAFNALDLVAVLRGGKFETGEAASWAEGDWNRDGVFNKTDIVLGLSTGCYGLPAPVENVSTATVLFPVNVFDPFFTMNAGTVFIPDGWDYNVGVEFGQPSAFPSSSFLFAATPDRTLGVERYTGDPTFTFGNGPLGLPTIGQPDPVRGLIFSPPVDGATYFQQSILPNLQQQHPDYQILDIRQEPGMIAAQVNSNFFTNQLFNPVGANIEFDAISARAQYRIGGQLIEETVVATFSYTNLVNAGFVSTGLGANQHGTYVRTRWSTARSIAAVKDSVSEFQRESNVVHGVDDSPRNARRHCSGCPTRIQ